MGGGGVMNVLSKCESLGIGHLWRHILVHHVLVARMVGPVVTGEGSILGASHNTSPPHHEDRLHSSCNEIFRRGTQIRTKSIHETGKPISNKRPEKSIKCGCHGYLFKWESMKYSVTEWEIYIFAYTSRYSIAIYILTTRVCRTFNNFFMIVR